MIQSIWNWIKEKWNYISSNKIRVLEVTEFTRKGPFTYAYPQIKKWFIWWYIKDRGELSLTLLRSNAYNLKEAQKYARENFYRFKGNRINKEVVNEERI